MATCISFLRARDIASTIKWYERLGFKCTGTNHEPGCDLDWAMLDWEGAVFMLYPDERQQKSENKDAGLYFNVESIDPMIEALKKVQAHIVEINEETFFGRREVVFHDNNGFQVTFSSAPIKRQMKEPRIELLPATTLVGMHMSMSLTENKTGLLWSQFMPRRREVNNTLSPELYSLQAMDTAAYYQNFNPGTVFEKWAALAVNDRREVPAGMEVYHLPAGLYAVFIHTGPPEAFMKTFGFIFNTWLPGSAYMLDSRPYFEKLGEKYKNGAADSEEEIWIPVKKK